MTFMGELIGMSGSSILACYPKTEGSKEYEDASYINEIMAPNNPNPKVLVLPQATEVRKSKGPSNAELWVNYRMGPGKGLRGVREGLSIDILRMLGRRDQNEIQKTLIEMAKDHFFWVHGGDTRKMKQIWDRLGVGSLLINLLTSGQDIRIGGESAGAGIWTLGLPSDLGRHDVDTSNKRYVIVKGYGLMDFGMLPHFKPGNKRHQTYEKFAFNHKLTEAWVGMPNRVGYHATFDETDKKSTVEFIDAGNEESFVLQGKKMRTLKFTIEDDGRGYRRTEKVSLDEVQTFLKDQ